MQSIAKWSSRKQCSTVSINLAYHELVSVAELREFIKGVPDNEGIKVDGGGDFDDGYSLSRFVIGDTPRKTREMLVARIVAYRNARADYASLGRTVNNNRQRLGRVERDIARYTKRIAQIDAMPLAARDAMGVAYADTRRRLDYANHEKRIVTGVVQEAEAKMKHHDFLFSARLENAEHGYHHLHYPFN